MTTVVNIPSPPSVNMLFRNVPGKGRVKTKRYLTWQRAAQNEILSQKPEYIPGPVSIEIVCRRNTRADIDNLAKGPIDLLVSAGVIDDDRNVERLSICWGDVEGARISISSVPRHINEDARDAA